MEERSGGSDPGLDLDEVRRQLRKLGYLRTPVDRFLLGGSKRLAAHGLAIGSAALRVAVVGSPILGALLVVALLFQNFPHLNRFPDVFVLYFYSVLVSGGFLFLAHIAGSLMVISTGRREGRTLPVAAARGVGFGLGALLGLYLGWRLPGATAGAEPATTAVRIGFLAGILMVGLWIGSVLARGLIGTLLRGGAHRGMAAIRRGHATWAVWTFLPVSVVFLVWVLQPSGSPAGHVGVVPPVQPRPVEGRLVLLGIDGLDRDGLGEVWKTPGHSLLLEPVDAAEPPAVWTSLMTGFPPERHGIHAFQSLQLMGIGAPLRELYLLRPMQDALNLLVPGLQPVEHRPVNAGYREAKTVWEILGEHGRRPVALNWWATWPAPVDGQGTVVTERAYFKLLAGGSPEGETRPPELFLELQAGFRAAQERRHRLAEAFLEGTDLEAETRDLLIRSLVGDMFQLELGREFARRPDAGDLFVYLSGLDIVRTELLGGLSPASAPGLRRGLDILESYHRFLAGWVGEFAGGLGPDDLLVVIGDPGRWSRRHGPETGNGRTVFAIGFQATGPLAIAVKDPSCLDLAPTLLALRGFPRSEEMPGQPLFRGAGQDQDTIPSYGRPGSGAGFHDKSTFDQDMLEQLRSLGYLR